jgi:hypothetical protein
MKEIRETAGRNTITTSAKCSHLSPEHNKGIVDWITGIAQSRASTD